MSVTINASYAAVPTALGSVPSTSVGAATSAAPTPPAAPATPAAKPERPELEQAVKDIQDYMVASQRNLEFSIDDTTHDVVVKVVATDTGEVIRQLPTELALKLAQSFKDGDNQLLDMKI